jgi:hypothetical protein
MFWITGVGVVTSLCILMSFLLKCKPRHAIVLPILFRFVNPSDLGFYSILYLNFWLAVLVIMMIVIN